MTAEKPLSRTLDENGWNLTVVNKVKTLEAERNKLKEKLRTIEAEYTGNCAECQQTGNYADQVNRAETAEKQVKAVRDLLDSMNTRSSILYVYEVEKALRGSESCTKADAEEK